MESKDNFYKSYSQFGEDLMLKSIFAYIFNMDLKNLKYVDIGANFPITISNTFNLYENGGSGILVEPNPSFLPLYSLERPRDIVISAGIKFKDGADEALYYDFGYYSIGLNTFSEERKNEVEKQHKLVKTRKIPLIDINDVFSKMEYIDFVSLDVEGVELEILKTIDFSNKKLRPKLFCVEANKTEIECGYKSELTLFMNSNDYIMVADNFTNVFYADLSQIKANPNFPIYHNGKLFD